MSYAFPYFGAGEAAYFELAEMFVRFVRKPKPAEQQAIMAAAPPTFQQAPAFWGEVLAVGSEGLVHPALLAYDADPGDEDDVSERAVFAAPSRVRRFNAQIEAWLHAAHAIVPVAFALRPQDWEAGGTALSPWHGWSLAQLDAVLALFEPVLTQKRRTPAADLLEELLDQVEEASLPIPDAFLQWWQPHVGLAQVLATGDPARAATALARCDAETLAEALRSMNLTAVEVARPLLAIATALEAAEAGRDAVVVATAVLAEAPALRGTARHLQAASSAFVRASLGRPAKEQVLIYEVGTRALPKDDVVLGLYLQAISQLQAFAGVDRSLLQRAAKRGGNAVLLLCVTQIAYQIGEPELGLSAVAAAESLGPLPYGVHLNAALLAGLAGDAAHVRAWAAQAAATGDKGAVMLEPVALVCEGRLDDAVAALAAVAPGYAKLRQWQDDAVFAALCDRADYQALFR